MLDDEKALKQGAAAKLCEAYVTVAKDHANFAGQKVQENDCFKTLLVAEITANTSPSGLVRSGRAYVNWGTEYQYYPIEKYYGPSRHMTLIFNIFVFM